MTERTDPTGEDEIRHREEDFGTDLELDAELDVTGAEMATDLDISHAEPEPDTAPPPPRVPRYDTKKVPSGGDLTAKKRIDEARLELHRLHDAETAKLLTPQALQERLGHENLKEFVKEALVSLKEDRPIDSGLMARILTFGNAPEQLGKAAEISGVVDPHTEEVKITEETLEELAKRIQEWAKETITLEMERDDRRQRNADSGKSWYKRGWVKKTGLVMAVGVGAPIIAASVLPLAAAGWATWCGIGAVATLRIGDAQLSSLIRGRKERKKRDAKLADMDNSTTHDQLTLEALSFVSARMNENAEENPEEQALTRARSEYAARLIKGWVSDTEKSAYEASRDAYFITRRTKILRHLGAEEDIDLETSEHCDLKEHVNAIMALARADERNRLVEAQVDAQVGDGKRFPGTAGKIFGAVLRGTEVVSKKLGVARTDYRLGYAVAMTTGSIIAKATEGQRVWGAAIGAMGGSALAESLVAARLDKQSATVIEAKDIRSRATSTRRIKNEATDLLDNPNPTMDALDTMIAKVRKQVDAAEVYRKLGQKLRTKDAAEHVQNLTIEQRSLHDIMVALQSLRGIFTVSDAADLTDDEKQLAKDQGELTKSRKNKIFYARVGGAIVGGTAGFFITPDAIKSAWKSSWAWAQGHMPGVDHVPDVVPGTTSATPKPPDMMSAPAPAADTGPGSSGAPSAGGMMGADAPPDLPGSGAAGPDATHTADVASTAAGTGTSPEVLQDAVVHKGEGIEHALKRQLIESPTEHGFKGDPNDASAVKSWAGSEAHNIALDDRNAYVTQDAETRVRIPDKYAYVLNSDGTVTEYEVTPSGAGDFEVVRPSGNATTLDGYEYKVPLGTHETVHVPHADIHVDTPDADVAAEPHGTIDTSAATAGVEPDHKALDALLSSLHTAQDSGDTTAVAQAQAAVAEFGQDHPDTLFDAATQTTTEVGGAAQSEGIQQLNDMLDAGSGIIKEPRAFHDALVNVFRTLMPDDDAQKLVLTIGEIDPTTREVSLNASDVSHLLKFDQSGFDVDRFTHMKDDFYAELNQYTLPNDGEWHPRHPMGLTSTADLPDRTDEVWLVRRDPGFAGKYEIFNSSLSRAGNIEPEALEQMLKPAEDVTPQVPVEPVAEPAETPAPAEAPDTDAETVDDTEATVPIEPLPSSVSNEPIMGDTSHEKVLSASDDTDTPPVDETPAADAEASDATPTSEYADLFARPSTEIPNNVHLTVNPDAHAYMREHDIKIDVDGEKVVITKGGGAPHALYVPFGDHELHFEMIGDKLYSVGQTEKLFDATYIPENGDAEYRGGDKIDELENFRAKEPGYHERVASAIAQDREEAAKAAAEKSAPVAPEEISARDAQFKLETTNNALNIIQSGLSMQAILNESDPATLSAIQEKLQAYIGALDSQQGGDQRGIANLLRDAQSAVTNRLETLDATTLRPAA